ERILAGVGVDLPKLRRDLDETMNDTIDVMKRGEEREPAQTVAFRRVLQTAAMHVQSAQREEVQAGDILAAILQQPQTRAAQLLAAQGVTRLDVLEFLSHGITKTPLTPEAPGSDPDGEATAGEGREGSATAHDPLSAYCTNLTERARQGKL